MLRWQFFWLTDFVVGIGNREGGFDNAPILFTVASINTDSFNRPIFDDNGIGTIFQSR